VHAVAVTVRVSDMLRAVGNLTRHTQQLSVALVGVRRRRIVRTVGDGQLRHIVGADRLPALQVGVQIVKQQQ